MSHPTAPPYFGVPNRKLGMWLFLASDSLTFAALLICCGYLRAAHAGDWPTPFHPWPSIALATLMTSVLLLSSLTMVQAVQAAKNGDKARTTRLLLTTAALGMTFVALHASEWRSLIDGGMTLTSNLFATSFFTLTGLHMLHVLIGVVYLVAGAVAGKSRWDAEDVEVCGLYWHFVDLVWMFIFPIVYLLAVAR